MTSLHDCIATENDLELLISLLARDQDPNHRDSSGRTPLHIVVLKCESNPQDTEYFLGVVRELIFYGADVNLGNNLGKTPLHLAVGCRNYKMIEILLEWDADINQMDNGGYAPLHYATSQRRFRRDYIYDLDLDVVRLLLMYGADINIQSRNKETALMLAAQNDNLLIIRLLLKLKAYGSLQDITGNSAMHYALQCPEVNVEIVTELFSYGCSFNMTDDYGLSPIDSYIWSLLRATRTEVEKAKFVFRLYIFDKNHFDANQQMRIREISKKTRCRLPEFISLCRSEIEQMRADTLERNFHVRDVALQGAFCGIFSRNSHIPLEAFDEVIDKLIQRQYPVYCDLIAAGICRPYISTVFAEMCCNTKMNGICLTFSTFFSLSYYLSNFDMLNVMIACSEGWRKSWSKGWSCFFYLPRLPYSSWCSIS